MDADVFRAWITDIAAVIREQRDHLTQLDAAIGDADHGANLDRGFTAVVAALEADPPATPGAVLTLTGRTLISKVGGASGPLYGTAFRRAGKSLGDTSDVDLAALAAALEAALGGIQQLGAAKEGDKTMVDVLAPATSAFSKAVAEGQSAARRAGRAGGGGSVRSRGHRLHAGAQGPGQLPRPAQRRPRGSRRGVVGADPRRAAGRRPGGPMKAAP